MITAIDEADAEPCQLTCSRPRRTLGHGLGRSIRLRRALRQPGRWRRTRANAKKVCFGRKPRTLRLSRRGRCRRRRLGLCELADFERIDPFRSHSHEPVD
jgi:hypothetical protein